MFVCVFNETLFICPLKNVGTFFFYHLIILVFFLRSDRKNIKFDINRYGKPNNLVGDMAEYLMIFLFMLFLARLQCEPASIFLFLLFNIAARMYFVIISKHKLNDLCIRRLLKRSFARLE